MIRPATARFSVWVVVGCLSLGCSGATRSTDEPPENSGAKSATVEASVLIPAPSVADNPPNDKSKLEVGQVAPDIVGADFEGVAFKLSDYRGQVVLLDFWGDS